MYSWSRSIVDKKDENPFWNGQGIDFIKDVKDGKVFNGKYSDIDIWISKLIQELLKTTVHSMKNIWTCNFI